MAKLRALDVAEVAVGASVLAMPLAVTQEVWDLSADMPWINTIMIVVVSCFILSGFIYMVQGGPDPENVDEKYHIEHLKRILVTYGVTLLVCAVILFLVTKLPLFTDPGVAFQRTVLVAFPACFSATVVDNLKQPN